MTADRSDVSPVVQGRVAFEVHCAPCHGPTGAGGYMGPSLQPPRIAGADVATIIHQVRGAGKAMPVFPSAVLPDASLHDLALYVHETLARPREEPARIGPRELDPFVVGLVAWGGLVLLACALAALFAEGRR